MHKQIVLGFPTTIKKVRDERRWLKRIYKVRSTPRESFEPQQKEHI